MIGRVVLAVCLAMSVALVPAAAEAAPAKCERPLEPGLREISRDLWGQKRLNVERAWPFTMGAGVTVAVIDSGVSRHRQIPLIREVDLSGTGNGDCMGHGTAVAGIIAGNNRTDFEFHGMAPRAKIVSYKQTNTDRGDVGILAQAITKAADAGVDVINISTQATDQPDLKAAVEYALARDVVIVAAAGNSNPDEKEKKLFPAAYEGVLSVGSVTRDGQRSDFSNTLSKVTVMAPGQDVTSTWADGLMMEELKGTSFAAPYVAGVAALVRSRYPRLKQDEVRRRIELTADGGLGAGTGAGVVNPLLAVTAVLSSEQVALAPPLPPPLPESAISKVPPVDWRAITVSVIVGASALVLAGIVVAAKVVMPLGRRRGWRAGSPN